MNWLLSIFNKKPSTISNGARVRTALGTGVIIGGCVNIRYDQDVPVRTLPGGIARGVNNRAVSHNLDKVELI